MDLLFQQEAHICGSLGERSEIRQKTPEYQPPGSADRLSRPPSNQQLVWTKDDPRDDEDSQHEDDSLLEGETKLPTRHLCEHLDQDQKQL